MSSSRFNALARLPSRLADLCYPRDCAACGLPAGETYRWLCEECATKLPLTRAANCCALCGKPFEGIVSQGRICPDCADLKPDWTCGKTLMLYAGPGAEIVRRLKYNGEKCLLADIRRILRARPDVLEMLRGTVLVPVPLHSGRHRERGYNQSLWLAEMFAEESGAGCQDILQRLRDTGTQTALDREERRKNVRGAFALRRGAKVYAGQSYVLVDDVITTGATLDACAGALRKAGATNAAVLTLAHA
jgi:competence protein ComFC